MAPAFDLSTVDLGKLNSMTRYPGIPTYHVMDGMSYLTSSVTPYQGPVVGREKVQGTPARIICTPDGRVVIASRKELLYATGDTVRNPSGGVVELLAPELGRFAVNDGVLRVYYLEIYGGGLPGGLRYTSRRDARGFVVYDIAEFPHWEELLDCSHDAIASWRERGRQQYLSEADLVACLNWQGLEPAPWVFTVDADQLPTGLEQTRDWLEARIPYSKTTLDSGGLAAEGIVMRTPDRSVISKARFTDYDRTLTWLHNRRMSMVNLPD